MDSSEIIGNSPEVLKFNWLFFELNWFICNQQLVLTVHCDEYILNGCGP